MGLRYNFIVNYINYIKIWRTYMSKNRTDVYICNKKYTLESEESSEFIMGVSRVVDKKFQEIFERDENVSLVDAAILVSLELVSENVKMARKLDEMKKQIKSHSEDSNQIKEKIISMSKKIEELYDKNKKLQAEVDLNRLKNTINTMNNK